MTRHPSHDKRGIVQYSKFIPALGILAGLALMFVFPFVMLEAFSGQNLSEGTVSGVIILGVSGGFILALFSAVFGIATPSRVEGRKPESEPQVDVKNKDSDSSWADEK